MHALEDQQVFFSHISYGQTAISSNNQILLSKLDNFTLVTGIANPKPLVTYLKSKSSNFVHLSFKDHYQFTLQDIAKLEQRELILTTEKDFVRLEEFDSLKDKLFYLPIEIKIDREEAFNKIILDFVNSY